MLYKNEYLWQFILHKGAAFLKKVQNIREQFYSYFKGIIAIESNLLNSKSLDLTSSSKYERRVHNSETINQSMYW